MSGPDNLLTRLRARGDLVTVGNGRLEIKSASGHPVPHEWLEPNRRRLLIEAAQDANMLALEYLGFSVGNYGPSRYGGVTLQFCCMGTGRGLYAIFNVETLRQRNTKHGKEGDPLPKGHFTISRRHDFYRFWKSTGFPVRRLSDFHDYMGKLTGLTYTARISSGERLDAKTLRPLNLAFSDYCPTEARQASDINPTSLPDKECPQRHGTWGFQQNQSTGQKMYGNTVTRERGYTGSNIPPELQTDEEWFAAYEGANGPHCTHVEFDAELTKPA